jgi:hypothetical protein
MVSRDEIANIREKTTAFAQSIGGGLETSVARFWVLYASGGAKRAQALMFAEGAISVLITTEAEFYKALKLFAEGDPEPIETFLQHNG